MSYKRVENILTKKDDYNALNESTTSTETQTSEIVVDMFGNDVNRKGEPHKGTRYLVFTVIMIILLSILVSLSTKSQINNYKLDSSASEIAQDNIHNDQKPVVDHHNTTTNSTDTSGDHTSHNTTTSDDGNKPSNHTDSSNST